MEIKIEMKEECLICKAPLEYLKEDVEMECAVCHKKENSKTRCANGHYVCSECHTKGMDSIIGVCLNEQSKNPVEIIEKMMEMPFCHMHGPEHHVMVGAALLTAYHNAGGEVDLNQALPEIYRRGKEVPGGACGFCNLMTSRALGAIGSNGGPRCCKRDSYLAIMEAVKFTEEKIGVKMELGDIKCTRSEQNNQCLHKACPFHGGK